MFRRTIFSSKASMAMKGAIIMTVMMLFFFAIVVAIRMAFGDVSGRFVDGGERVIADLMTFMAVSILIGAILQIIRIVMYSKMVIYVWDYGVYGVSGVSLDYGTTSFDVSYSQIYNVEIKGGGYLVLYTQVGVYKYTILDNANNVANEIRSRCCYAPPMM